MPSDPVIPLFPLGLVLLPHMPLPLHIFEERYKSMIAECLKKNTRFGIVFLDGSDIRMVGCTARILKVLKRYSDGRLDILTQGEERFVIKEMFDRKPYLEGRVDYFDDEPEENTDQCQNLARNGMAMLKQFTTISEMQDAYGFTERLDNKSISFVIAGFEQRRKTTVSGNVLDRQPPGEKRCLTGKNHRTNKNHNRNSKNNRWQWRYNEFFFEID